ncbi:MAG: hypothetical protein AAFR98_03330 [Pseudomonadota bacterium]
MLTNNTRTIATAFLIVFGTMAVADDDSNSVATKLADRELHAAISAHPSDFELVAQYIKDCTTGGVCVELDVKEPLDELSCSQAIIQRLGEKNTREQMFRENLEQISEFLYESEKIEILNAEDLVRPETLFLIKEMPRINRYLLQYQLGMILQAASSEYFLRLLDFRNNPNENGIKRLYVLDRIINCSFDLEYEDQLPKSEKLVEEYKNRLFVRFPTAFYTSMSKVGRINFYLEDQLK